MLRPGLHVALRRRTGFLASTGEVKHRLGQRRAEEEANLHGAQGHRLGWEQHQPVVSVTQRIGGVQRGRQRFMQERAERGVGPPLAG